MATAKKRQVAKQKPKKRLVAKPKPRKKNPLKKWVFFVGPQFPDTEKGKRECLEFGQRFATQYGVPGHVYKA